MRNPLRPSQPGGASGPTTEASAALPHERGGRFDEPGSDDDFPGLLPIWRSDWMRLRWVFLVAAAVLLASLGWSIVAARPRPLALVLALGELLVFVGLALEGLLGHRRRAIPARGRRGLLLVAAMTLAAAAFVMIERGALGIVPFFLAGIMAGRLRPDTLAVRAIGVIALVSVLVMLPFSSDAIGILVNGISVGILSLTVYGIRVLQRTNRELVLARDELARYAVAEERLRIARDLHDVLGQDLSVMALKSELARRLLPSEPNRAASEIEDIERTAREALKAVRETVSGYRQPVLSVELAGAREALAAAGIALSVEGDTAALPSPVEAILAWTVREGTTNVIRHSGARRCLVRVGRNPSSASLELLDDGHRGDEAGDRYVTRRASASEAVRTRDAARAPASAPASAFAPGHGAAAGNAGTLEPIGGSEQEHGHPGSGLPGLAERVAASGGQMEAGPQPGGGFRLKVSVPLSAAAVS